uniref:Uncharacterized protein n=1 Tax=Oryza sativa subsp. japonica TaxID=39947 RepID=Q6AVC8_ORYSJ|nr:hypothetical protein [Oryza sativa Japonica Group]
MLLLHFLGVASFAHACMLLLAASVAISAATSSMVFAIVCIAPPPPCSASAPAVRAARRCRVSLHEGGDDAAHGVDIQDASERAASSAVHHSGGALSLRRRRRSRTAAPLDGSDDDQFKFTPDSNNEVDDHRFSLDQEFVPETEF